MHLGSVTAHPSGEWTMQQARDPAPTPGQQFEDIKFLIRDRGPNFTASFDAVFQATGTTILRTDVQAPRMNATCERLVGTLRRELLDRTLIQRAPKESRQEFRTRGTRHTAADLGRCPVSAGHITATERSHPGGQNAANGRAGIRMAHQWR
jgi:putative transposase